MRLNTLEKLYLAAISKTPEIVVSQEIRVVALKPIQKMLELSFS
ncbi:quinolinate synthetase A [Trichodesmium erythraeum IMS101]|uniref:Quinolinate synthetase A n=1 Tax=Trichodesmium erythraeum (strain IMS101) TaxID=203124 RepID=Q10W50_TRIEI